ncbi:bis(5'-nucleosyl)-tetraphosphatase (symmetrical) YqeK [Abyssisolibacter fermentans]|uniref:bis(5'-nucleosyl)-tetraphosphatase (symmetrical) YqeK n=1 Tax=Abyssisolibacter fermentans TaxID=1766203 RepID=UPI00082E0CE4|nr:bis(5'-nucleosyl)-tetraphosphatase (symmetrical) YqeK [Abyssisolibacter fermentans]
MYELIQKYKDQLIKDIGGKRFDHSVRVMDTAKRLAIVHREDEKKAEIAGLLHDCGRFIDDELLLKNAKKFGIIRNDYFKDTKELMHAELGACIAKNIYDIKDMDIINAIRYHTTGRENMSRLEKIVFLADYIEPARDFCGVEEIRKLSFRDLDLAILKALDNTIKFLIQKNQYLHIRTVEARNYLLQNNISYI